MKTPCACRTPRAHQRAETAAFTNPAATGVRGRRGFVGHQVVAAPLCDRGRAAPSPDCAAAAAAARRPGRARRRRRPQQQQQWQATPRAAAALDDGAVVPGAVASGLATDGSDCPAAAAGGTAAPLRSILGFAIGPKNARLLLVLVTFTWGSFPVLLKFMYAPSFTWALRPFPFNALRLVLGACTCAPFVWRLQPAQWTPAIAAGTELGILTLLVNFAQLLALAHTSAGRLSFIAQLQTLFVPLAMIVLSRMRPTSSSLSTNAIPVRAVLMSSIAAVAGTLLLALDRPTSGVGGGGAMAAAGLAPAALWKGDAFGLASAVFAAAYIIRSRVHAVRLPATALAGTKVMSQAVFAVVHVLGTAVFRGARPSSAAQWSQAFFAGASTSALALNAACLFYGGAIVCGLSTVVQIGAQAHVSASEAALIFAFIPVWTAVVAALCMREMMGPMGIAGALCIVASSIFTAVASRRVPSALKNA